MHKATELLKKIVRLRASEKEEERPVVIMGYTSNMMSCGAREIINYMCRNKLVDAIVTTGGGIEEDFMKVFADAYIIDYVVDDRKMRRNGHNRIGNMVVPNESYVTLENWLTP